MRVDAHHHIWDLTVRDQPWTAGLPALRRSFGLDELRPRLRAHGIDATVLVQTVPVAGETPELLAQAAADPHVAAVVGWTDLRAADVAGALARLRAAGGPLAGIRHPVQDEPDERWLCRPDVRRGLAAVAEAGLAYDLLLIPPQLPAAVETARDLPQLRFILDHAAKPRIAAGQLQPWADDLKRLAALPNVAVKLSGLVTEADPRSWTAETLRPYAEVVLGAFGPERVMFGSDWPVCLLAAGYDEVLAAAEALTAVLTPAERDSVFGATAAAWYRLERR